MSFSSSANYRALKKPFLFGIFILLLSGCGDCDDTNPADGTNPRADADGDISETKDTAGPKDVSHNDARPDSSVTDTQDVIETPDIAECAPENQCAGQCCASDQLCLRDACVRPGAACAHNLECASGEICEPSMGRCIPDPGVVCEHRPETDIFEPTVTVAWNEPPASEVPVSPNGVSNQVMMTPSVIDLNEDGIPEIIFSSFTNTSFRGKGVLRAIDGKTYEPLFSLTAPEKLVSAAASLAVGDIDGDGRVEIIAAAWNGDAQREIIAFDDYTTNWTVLWKTNENLNVGNGGIALADLNADGQVEVYGANWVLDAQTGELQCDGDGVSGGNANAIAADLDGDGNMEVVAPGGVFKFQPTNGLCPKLWSFTSGNREAAVGDFGTFTNGQRDFGALDGIPEVVSVSTAASDQVQLHDGQTGEIIWATSMPTGDHPIYDDTQCTRKSGAGAPTIADFDGDGAPEIGAAGACFYAVFETDGTLKWKNATRDFSSRITGSSVFDFQGDGKAEVVYADECFIRVYDGSGNGDGSTNILFERPHTSGTARELPVVADVNNNYHANIVVISNDDYRSVQGARCAAEWPAFGDASNAEHGIFVLKDAQDRWVSTRPVWNQHAYHVTNVCDGRPGSVCPGRTNTAGAIPIGELDNWAQPGLNNYRQNVQGEGLFNAPDLSVTNLATDCDAADGVTFHVTISNLGTRGIPEGTNVAVYVTIGAGAEQYLATLTTTQRLLPGGAETLTYVWAGAPDPSGSVITVRAVADADEDGNGQHNECHEDNNERQSQATCACQIDTDCNPGEVCASTGECLPMDG